MNSKKTILALLFLLPAVAAFASTTGQITYLEGSVSVSRNGNYLPTNQITLGVALEEYDIVETGADGYVEITILSDNSSNGSIVKVKENTSYYFKVEQQANGGKNTIFTMLTGALSFRVNKLSGDDSLDIQTGNTTMGVRGTNFTIYTVPDGSVLVACDEGKVACESDGEETFSFPGQAVEKIPQQRIQSLDVPVDELDEFASEWQTRRMEALQINMPVSMEYYLGQYGEYQPRMDRAYRKLAEFDAIFRKWDRYIQEGHVPPMSEAKQDEITVAVAMTEVRSLLPMYEQIFYTLSDLDRLYRNGVGEGVVESRTVRKLRSFRDQQDDVSEQLNMIRYYIRIYIEMKKAGSAVFPDGGGINTDDIFSGPNLF